MVRSGVLIALRTFCSAGDSARSEATARSVSKIGSRAMDIVF